MNAEKIETVTIYYSDLVDFTELYSDSTPFEVGFFVWRKSFIALLFSDGDDAELLLQDV